MGEKCYICIDLKSFYASVECVERGLDPMTTPLVVADKERTKATICLAVSPEMKRLGVKNRCRLFEIPNNIEYIIAPPRMQKYIDYAAEIYSIYLDYISSEDIFQYSIDEVFIDATSYLKKYNNSGKEMAIFLMNKVKEKLRLRTTAGVGTNLYLCKIALDILAKKDKDFIGVLDEEKYKKELWDYRPLRDFWRIGRGTEETLSHYGIYTMRSITEVDEDFLYKKFGVNAELLIDHAWGRESVTMEDIQNYKPKNKSICQGQVLPREYEKYEGRIVLKEMVQEGVRDVIKKEVKVGAISLYISYGKRTNKTSQSRSKALNPSLDSPSILEREFLSLYESLVGENETVKRLSLSFGELVENENSEYANTLFPDEEKESKQKNVEKVVLEIKEMYGNNSILRGTNFENGATGRERNNEIGGHKK